MLSDYRWFKGVRRNKYGEIIGCIYSANVVCVKSDENAKFMG